MAGRKSQTKKGTATRKNPEKKEAVSGQVKAGVVFSPARLNRYMRKGRYSERQGQSAGYFMAGVLDYLCSELLEGAGGIAEQHKPKAQLKPYIKPKHIQMSIRTDPEFEKLMANIQISDGGCASNI